MSNDDLAGDALRRWMLNARRASSSYARGVRSGFDIQAETLRRLAAKSDDTFDKRFLRELGIRPDGDI